MYFNQYLILSAHSREAYAQQYSRPAKRKTERRVAETRGVASKTSGHGQPSSHLTQSSHDEEDDETKEQVTDEQRTGTRIGKSRASADNETSSNSTTNGNHSNMTSLETTVEGVILVESHTTDMAGGGEVCAIAFLVETLLAVGRRGGIGRTEVASSHGMVCRSGTLGGRRR